MAFKGSQPSNLEGFDGADRFVKGLGDLFVVPTIQKFEHNDLALVWCERFQGVSDPLLFQSHLYPSFGARFGIDMNAGLQLQVIWFILSVIVGDPIVSRPEQVGLKVPAWASFTMKGVKETTEGLCDTIFRQVLISKKSHGVAVQPWAVLIVDFSQGLLVETAGTG
jgi:hypothetical protein